MGATMGHANPLQTQQKKETQWKSPVSLLMTALDYGEALWEKDIPYRGAHPIADRTM
jgi:hypothetical protein